MKVKNTGSLEKTAAADLTEEDGKKEMTQGQYLISLNDEDTDRHSVISIESENNPHKIITGILETTTVESKAILNDEFVRARVSFI